MKDLIPKKMHGVLLTGHGGIEKLEYLLLGSAARFGIPESLLAKIFKV